MPYTSLEAMAAAAAQFDRHPDVTVYHACSSYKHPFLEIDGKKKYRVPQNTLAAKALWVDIDCGADKAADGKGYPDKRAGATAVVAFCKTAGFPLPLFVDSGNGVHAYWPLTEAITADEWKPLATTFKSVLRHFGVLADPTRTADFASILRPVGTHNKKKQDNWKPVIAKNGGQTHDVAAIMAALSNIVSNHDVECEPVPKSTGSFLDALPDVKGTATVNDDLLAHSYPDIPVNAEVIAEKCQQIKLMLGQGKGYEHWRGVMGIVHYCEDRDRIAHEWSSQHPLYDKAATQQKIDTWNTPPTTCAFFASCNPSGCEGCMFQGKITTPLQLGRGEVEPQAGLELTAQVNGKVETVEVPPMPHGYRVDETKQTMYRVLKDKDGVPQAHEFAKLIFYPTTRISRADGTFMVRVRAHMPDKTIRDFDIPTNMLASQQELLKSLADYEITASTASKDSHMHITAYMRDSLHRLLHASEEMKTMTAFGWKNNMDSFLIGDRLYNKDSSVRRVILGGIAASSKDSFPEPRGTVQGWTDGVNFLYNREKMEPMQYAICSGFGSILTPLGDESYHGIPLALTGSESGKGKTTACKAAIYAFGDAEKILVNGRHGATVNARWGEMAAMQNIPILFDEMSGVKPADLAELLYGASNGKDKKRMVGTKHGVEMATTLTWDMSIFITANNELNAILASEKGNSQAEAMRVMEIKTDMYATPSLKVAQVQAAVNQITRNMGTAGEAFVKYVVENLDDVTKRFIAVSDRLTDESAEAQDQKHRYYRNHATCTLTAAQIMVELGLIDFDVENLFQWIVRHIATMSEEVAENNTMTPQEALGRMITDYGPQIITTHMYRDGRNGGMIDQGFKFSKPAIGRRILGDADRKEPLAGRLYLSKKEIKDWCQKNRVPTTLITDWLEQEGLVIKTPGEAFNISRGTDNTTGLVRCLCIDYDKMQDIVTGAPRLVHTKSQKSGEDEEAA